MIRGKRIAHAVYEMPHVSKQIEYHIEVLDLTQIGKDKVSAYLASTFRIQPAGYHAAGGDTQ